MKTILFVLSILLLSISAQCQKPIAVKPLPANEQELEIDASKYGKLYKAWQVFDKGGYTDFYLTMKSSGKFGDNGFTTALFGFAELNDHGGYVEQWNFKQYNQSPLQGIDLKNVKVEIKDMDNDGYAEYYICYYLYCDGLDADTWKVLVYNRNKKFLKRFYVLKQEEDKHEAQQNEPAEGWNNLPKPIRDYADKLGIAARKTTGVNP